MSEHNTTSQTSDIARAILADSGPRRMHPLARTIAVKLERWERQLDDARRLAAEEVRDD